MNMIFFKCGQGLADFFYVEGAFGLSNAWKHIRYTTNDVKLFETPRTRECLLLFLWKEMEI